MSLLSVIFVELTICAVALSVVWGIINVGISPVASSRSATNIIVEQAKKVESGIIVDLGSGWGGVAIAIAKANPKSHVVGYEISFFPWLVSRIYGNLSGCNNAFFYRKNFNSVDLSAPDMIVCFLFPGAMKELGKRLCDEQVYSYRIVSNTFPIECLKPKEVNDTSGIFSKKVYIYESDRG